MARQTVINLEDMESAVEDARDTARKGYGYAPEDLNDVADLLESAAGWIKGLLGEIARLQAKEEA